MPKARVCICGKLTTNKIRCDACEAKRPKPKKSRRSDQYRGSSTAKGYGSDWQRIREVYITDHPLCEDCEERGHITPAAEVHHKVPITEAPHRRLDITNLRALCVPCHREADAGLRQTKKTLEQVNRGEGKKKNGDRSRRSKRHVVEKPVSPG